MLPAAPGGRKRNLLALDLAGTHFKACFMSLSPRSMLVLNKHLGVHQYTPRLRCRPERRTRHRDRARSRDSITGLMSGSEPTDNRTSQREAPKDSSTSSESL